VLDTQVSFLRKEKESAKMVKAKLELLEKNEEELSYNLLKIDSLGTLYRRFWEENVPADLEARKEEILRLYDMNFDEFKERADFARDFVAIERECESISEAIKKLNGEVEKLLPRYEELFEGVKHYFKAGSMFVIRLQRNVIPKLKQSDKTRIDELLIKLRSLYEGMLVWIEEAIKQILDKNILTSELPKTRTAFHEEERSLREQLIREIKDLNAESTLILMEIVKVLSLRKTQWLSVAEVCEAVANQTNKDTEVIKKTLLEITERGFLTLGIGF
jgi:hypothetical protein